MTNSLLALMASAAIALTLSACMDNRNATNTPAGKYEKSTTRTDANGTKYESETETDVQYDEYGNKKAVVKSKTTKDPKGLMNKTTTSKTKTVIDEEAK